MKKLLQSLALLLVGIIGFNASAETVTLKASEAKDASGKTITTKTQPLTSCTIGDFSFSFSQNAGNKPGLFLSTSSLPVSIRVYNPTDVTITPPEGNMMTKVVFQLCDNNVTTKPTQGTNNLVNDATAKTWTWEGESSEATVFTFKATYKLESFIITYEPIAQGAKDFAPGFDASYSMKIGETVNFFEKWGEGKYPENITFTPAAEGVVSFEGGVMTAVKDGETTVNVAWEEVADTWTAGSASFDVKVLPQVEYAAPEIAAQKIAEGQTLELLPLFGEEAHPEFSFSVEPADLGTIADGIFTAATQGEGSITYSWTESGAWKAGEGQIAITVTEAPKTIELVLTPESLKISGTSYQACTYELNEITLNGWVSNSNGIQFNDGKKGTPSTQVGIVTTANKMGYKLIGISIETSSTKTLNVYGKDEAYSSTGDIASANGTLIGSLSKSNLSIVPSADKQYPFISISSPSGVVQCSKITLTFELPEEEVKPEVTVTPVAGSSIETAKTSIIIDGEEGKTYSATLNGIEIGEISTTDLVYYTSSADGVEYVAPTLGTATLAANTLYKLVVADGEELQFVTPPAVKTVWHRATYNTPGFWEVSFEEGGDATVYWMDERINGGNTGDETRAMPGYVKYEEPFTLEEGKTLSFYSAAGENESIQSPVVFTTPDDVTTGIEAIDAAGGEAVWYDLQGRKVSGDELAPGLYIRTDGRKAVKVIVR